MMRMDDKMVQILGTLYAVCFDVPEEKMPEGADGCMDQSTHMIKIAKIEASRESLQNLDSYKKKVLRHEIVHAFCMNLDYGIIVEISEVGDKVKK